MGSRERRPKQLLPNSTLRSSVHWSLPRGCGDLPDVRMPRSKLVARHSGGARGTRSYNAHRGRGSVGTRILALCPPGSRLLLAGHMRPHVCLPLARWAVPPKSRTAGTAEPGSVSLPSPSIICLVHTYLAMGVMHRKRRSSNTTGPRGIPFRGCGS
jgi:hypothetical protein